MCPSTTSSTPVVSAETGKKLPERNGFEAGVGGSCDLLIVPLLDRTFARFRGFEARVALLIGLSNGKNKVQ
jgi:hypothetical protein